MDVADPRPKCSKPASKWFQDLLDCTGCEMIMTSSRRSLRAAVLYRHQGQRHDGEPALSDVHLHAEPHADRHVCSPTTTMSCQMVSRRSRSTASLKQDAYNGGQTGVRRPRNNNYNASILTTKLSAGG